MNGTQGNSRDLPESPHHSLCQGCTNALCTNAPSAKDVCAPSLLDLKAPLFLPQNWAHAIHHCVDFCETGVLLRSRPITRY